MKIHTKQIAEKILKNNLLESYNLSLKDLFFIRDCLYGLDKFNLADQDLLKQVEKYLDQEREHRICNI